MENSRTTNQASPISTKQPPISEKYALRLSGRRITGSLHPLLSASTCSEPGGGLVAAPAVHGHQDVAVLA
jgi:hypothetical protein